MVIGQWKYRYLKMEKRKLASVQYVHHITPIEGADRIECVHVLGWQCVANKGQFKVEVNYDMPQFAEWQK